MELYYKREDELIILTNDGLPVRRNFGSHRYFQRMMDIKIPMKNVTCETKKIEIFNKMQKLHFNRDIYIENRGKDLYLVKGSGTYISHTNGRRVDLKAMRPVSFPKCEIIAWPFKKSELIYSIVIDNRSVLQVLDEKHKINRIKAYRPRRKPNIRKFNPKLNEVIPIVIPLSVEMINVKGMSHEELCRIIYN